MFDHETPFKNLISDLNGNKPKMFADGIKQECGIILKNTQPYVPYLKDATEDEFWAHIADVRREATTLHEECDKFIHSTDAQSAAVLLEIRQQWRSLCALIEMACVLKAPLMVEEVHAAL